MDPYRKPEGSGPVPDSCVLPFDMLELEARVRAEEAAQAKRAKRPEFVAGDYLLAVARVYIHRQVPSSTGRLQIHTVVATGPGGSPSPYAGRELLEICQLGSSPARAMCFSIISACQPDPAKLHDLLVACNGRFDMATLVGCRYWATLEIRQGYAIVTKRRGAV